jgi:hypothetical protein
VTDTVPLSRSAERTRAAGMIRTGTEYPLVVTPATAVLVADVLDLASWIILSRAGLDRDQARAVLAVLWSER